MKTVAALIILGLATLAGLSYVLARHADCQFADI